MTMFPTTAADVHGRPAPSLSAAPERGLPRDGGLLHQFTIHGQTFAVLAEDGSGPENLSVENVSVERRIASFRAGDQQFQLVELNPTTPTPGGRFSESQLTARELQIVELVAAGNSNKLISKRLQISEWTVGSHLRRIFLKLGVDTRAQMVHVCSARMLGGNGLSA